MLLANWESTSIACEPGAIGSSTRASAEELFEEVRKLRCENEYLKRQREILKKAASILAEDPQLGMR